MSTSPEHRDAPTKTNILGAAWKACVAALYHGGQAKRLSAGSVVAPFLSIYLVMLPLSLLGLDLIFAWAMGAFMQVVGLYGCKQRAGDLWTHEKKKMAWCYWLSGFFFITIAIFQEPEVYHCFPGVSFVMPGIFY